MTAVRLAQLNEGGVSFWIDGISRFLLGSDALAALVRDWRVSGATTNLELLHHAVATGSFYAEQLRDLAGHESDAGRAVSELVVRDIQNACDVLLPTHLVRHRTTGLVSVDMDPRLAHGREETLDSARALWQKVDRPNLLVKIPATDTGLWAITACLAEGIGVHATSVFSAERYQQVTDAHLAGLAQASEAGRPLSRIHSVASFHVSPVDDAVDPLLDAIGTDRALALRGRTALAVAHSILARHRETYAGESWQPYTEQGARRQQLVWAATAVSGSGYRDTHYADGLFAHDTVSAVSEQLLWAIADHGRVQQDEATGAPCGQALGTLAELGIPLAGILSGLEEARHQRSLASWQRLLDVVATALQQPRPVGT